MRFALACLVILAVAVPSTARAQKDKKAAARKLLANGDRQLKKGDRLMERGDKSEAQDAFLDALKSYKAAYGAVANPKIFFAIGLAEKRLGRYIESLEHFQLLLTEAPEVAEVLRSEVEKHIREVKENLGVIFFRVEPRGATIYVNDDEIGDSPLSQPHYVVPGLHKYRIEAEGHIEASGEVEVEAGEAREDEIVLQRLPTKPAKTDDDDELKIKKPKIVEGGPSKTPLWVGVGLTGAMVVGATATGLFALNKHDTFSDDMASVTKRDKARSRGQQLALATDVLVIGAVAAATYTAYYYFAVYTKGGVTKESAVTVMPAITPDAAGMVLGGRF